MLLRLLVVLLLAMNIGVAAWWALRPAPPAAPTPAAFDAAIEPLRLLSEVDAGAADPVAEVVGPPQPQLPDAERTCLVLGPFLTQVDLRRAMNALTPAAERIQFRESRTLIRRGFRVFIPSPGSRAAALERARELSARGLRDYYVVTAGAEQNSISLGLYREEANAIRRRDEVQAKGFEVSLEPRNEEVPQYFIDLELPRDFDWRSALGGYSGVNSSEIPCN